MRAAAGVVHARGGRGTVDVARLHQLLHVVVVLHQVLGQVWGQIGLTFEFIIQRDIHCYNELGSHHSALQDRCGIGLRMEKIPNQVPYAPKISFIMI